MSVPGWWQLFLLALAVARLTRLVGWDDLSLSLRRRLTGLGDEQHKQWAYVIDHQHEIGYDPWTGFGESDRMQRLSQRLEDATGNPGVPPLVRSADTPYPPVSARRYYLSKLVRCPWCVGFWIVTVWWLLWLAWPHAILIASTPLALSELVGLAAKNLDEH